MIHQEIREKFIKFFTTGDRKHKEIPSASLIPENDPTVLFITAGMHPLVPYLLGEAHPLGKRLVDIQKSFRTDDIDFVGDGTHFTFFEMLGNWSLGDYFKRGAIEWSFEFLTGKEWLGFDPAKIYISVFEGDSDAPRDEESIRIWQEVFKKVEIKAGVGDKKKGVEDEGRIFPYPKSKNWWGPAGTTGPCGPDTEMFYDTELPVHDKKKFGPVCHINCDCGRFVEVWNDVFMEYNKNADGSFSPLKQKNVDTGMGMERNVALTSWLRKMIAVPDPYLTDLFNRPRYFLLQLSGRSYEEPFIRSTRIILDHGRAVTFLISDGAEPGNKERGYVVRRLIRRAIRHGKILGIHTDFMKDLTKSFIDTYSPFYPALKDNEEKITETVKTEEVKFRKLLDKGLKSIEKEKNLTGKIAFDLYQSYGFPPELTFEIAREKGEQIDMKSFNEEFQKHQELSRTATKGVFKGGLQDHSEKTTRLHTATHLLQQALRDVLGKSVRQRGSHITSKRLRFDFTYPRKLTPEEIARVEVLVNKIIGENLKVVKEMVDFEDLDEDEVLTVPGVSYPERVSVYKIGNFSKEVCGGPHVDFTGKLGKFKIIKEEAAGSQSRRIYATLS